MAHNGVAPDQLPLDTHPQQYRHWRFHVEGGVATLAMNVQFDQAMQDAGYTLKLNSYDLGVDLELADAIQRVRFEHPEVRALVVTSDQDRVFCAGANIYMLGRSTHAFKVNFCKYTNETRLALEDLADHSGVATIAACNGTASGGGYELALACDQIVLVDDGNSAVSFPEAPLLAVLPGTGGLTRLVDKRRVRRDRADVFSTVAEGIKGNRAKKWNLVDALIPRSKWSERLTQLAETAAAQQPAKPGPGVSLGPVGARYTDTGLAYAHVMVRVDERVADVVVKGPTDDQPTDAGAFIQAGDQAWAIRAFRELDDALVRLRFEFPQVGLLTLRTEGSIDRVLAADRGVLDAQDHWLGREIVHLKKRVLKRLDLTARSMFALIEPGSCFAGSLLEIALAADRTYMLDDPDRPVHLGTNEFNAGLLPMSNGLTRLQTRFLDRPEHVAEVLEAEGLIDTETADGLGLVTYAPDDLDWEDEVRIAIEERINFSPDAMTGLEANLRFAGPETMETKIFGRLSAWQNWIFQRPNAVGEQGALTLYGKQTNPVFDMTRT